MLRSTDRGSTWDVLTLPSVFEVLADTAPEQLDLIVTPEHLPVPPGNEEKRTTTTTVAWVVVVIGAAALAVAVAVAFSRARRRG